MASRFFKRCRTVPSVGRQRILLNAHRFYDEGWGIQLMLLAAHERTPESAESP
jgi:hypothetical protein